LIQCAIRRSALAWIKLMNNTNENSKRDRRELTYHRAKVTIADLKLS